MEELEKRIEELEAKEAQLQKKIKELYHFIEMTDALTYDPKTSSRISSFLKEEGAWK
jgi:uncharacterized coiled-coil protein SlyX